MAKDGSDTRIDESLTTETRIAENPFTEDAGDAESSSSLSKAIQEHLDLKQRNAGLDGTMPLDRYAIEDPFENHPLFKSEEQARLEETVENAPTTESQPQAQWPGESDAAEPEGPALDEGLWGRSRDFDWGE